METQHVTEACLHWHLSVLHEN